MTAISDYRKLQSMAGNCRVVIKIGITLKKDQLIQKVLIWQYTYDMELQ